ncbi:glycosyltransferase family 4 protein [uncultured Selenomonas sp.]|jgi:glycosyl transferase GT4 family|uniref:glycosyltransferase family 4 protein n=1 Tax=uncultured Selenomonas sp. TaxID=159275 RepID=UPI0028E496A2|nr:glycosyltransferase family 4 protein [uncultured Selenomonas sp.]
MKIAMYGHKRIPSREGGIEVVVEELSTRMVKLGHAVTCYNRSGHHVGDCKYDIQVDFTDYKGVQLKKVFTIDSKGLAAMTSSFIAAINVSLNRYDIIHIHAEGPCFFCWIPKLFGRKVVVTIHGLDHMRLKWGRLAKTYIKYAEVVAAKCADEIIVLSEGVKKYFLMQYGRETILIPNGVSKGRKRKVAEIETRYHLCANEYILYLGRLVPEKGIDLLIKAFRQISTEKKLVIAGGGSDSKEYEKYIYELANNDSRVVFTGFVQGAVLEELYSNAYIYVLPSYLEGMPLSLMEAMSYGNCCLTSDISECVDVTNEYGFSFTKGNVNDLKNKLQYLIDNPLIVEQYKENSSDYICQKYNWDNIAKATLDIYAKCVE